PMAAVRRWSGDGPGHGASHPVLGRLEVPPFGHDPGLDEGTGDRAARTRQRGDHLTLEGLMEVPGGLTDAAAVPPPPPRLPPPPRQGLGQDVEGHVGRSPPTPPST